MKCTSTIYTTHLGNKATQEEKERQETTMAMQNKRTLKC
jgi:hypothetical protein